MMASASRSSSRGEAALAAPHRGLPTAVAPDPGCSAEVRSVTTSTARVSPQRTLTSIW